MKKTLLLVRKSESLLPPCFVRPGWSFRDLLHNLLLPLFSGTDGGMRGFNVFCSANTAKAIKREFGQTRWGMSDVSDGFRAAPPTQPRSLSPAKRSVLVPAPDPSIPEKTFH